MKIKYEIVDGDPPSHCECGKPFSLMPFYAEDLGGELYCPTCQPNILRVHKMRLKKWIKTGALHIQ